TIAWRRSHDYGAKVEPVSPRPVQSPGALAGLGFLPPDVNVVAGVHVAELLKDPAGKKLLEAPRAPLLDLLLGAVEKWTRLTPEQVASIALGTQIKDKIPQLTVVVETRLPYDPDELARALRPIVPTLQRGKPLFRFTLAPGEGM